MSRQSFGGIRIKQYKQEECANYYCYITEKYAESELKNELFITKLKNYYSNQSDTNLRHTLVITLYC